MTPLYRTQNMESAANLLCKHFRHVLVRAAYDTSNDRRIRFRADKLHDPRVFFSKVPSQFVHWQKKGGVLISWRSQKVNLPHEAIVFVECPKSMYGLKWHAEAASVVGVIYQPPTWRPLEERIAWRFKDPRRYANRMRHLEIVRDYVEHLPWFTRSSLQNLLRSRPAALASPRSPSGASPESAARSLDTPG